jgi:hypothetical protein
MVYSVPSPERSEASLPPERIVARLEDLLGREAVLLERGLWTKLGPLGRQITGFWNRLDRHPAFLQSIEGKAALTRIRQRVEANVGRLKTLSGDLRAGIDRERRLGRARRAYGGTRF